MEELASAAAAADGATVESADSAEEQSEAASGKKKQYKHVTFIPRNQRAAVGNKIDIS